MPLTTKAGDPSEDINSIFDIYKCAIHMSQDEKLKMSSEFIQTAKIVTQLVLAPNCHGDFLFILNHLYCIQIMMKKDGS